jgi:hypothetical protein
MSAYGYTPDSEDEFLDDTSGKGLRKQLEDALGEIKSLRKELQGDRKTQAETELKGMGLDPAVLGLAPDGADPVEWVKEKAHLLGGKKVEEETPPVDQPPVEVATDDDPALVAEREALAKIQEAQAAGSSQVVSNDLIEQMGKIDTEEELLGFFKQNGGLTA